MGTFYKKAGDDVNKVIKSMMKKYHGHLLKDAIGCDVTVDALLAFSEKGPPVTLHGMECYAKVRIVNLRDRVKGMADAEIIIDSDKWDTMNDERRNALIDHELEHLELALKKGAISFDDIGRPKLKIRHHDIDVGWFKSIAERHGKESIEIQQAHEIYAENQQLLFNFGGSNESTLVIPNAPKERIESAIHMTSKMLEIRDRFKTMTGDGYQESLKMMINYVKGEIKKSSDESSIQVITRLAKKALEDDGQMMRHDGIIAAYVEMHDQPVAAA